MGAELFWDFFFLGAGWVCRGGSVVVGGPGAAKTSAEMRIPSVVLLCGVWCVVFVALLNQRCENQR